MSGNAPTAASMMVQASKRACHQPPETTETRPAATPPRRSPRPRLMHQPLSAPKSAADLHAAPPPAARATTTCPEELDPTAVAPPSQRSPCMVLRRPLESAHARLIAVVDDIGRLALPQRHAERVQHQLCAEMVRHR